MEQKAAKLPATGTSVKNSVTNSATQKFPSKPSWQDLTASQQLSLMPLAANWNTLGEAQKRKWIAISANYPGLPPAEQAKLHSRMTEWVSLSQQQREQVRLNFAQSKKLSPNQKAATWQAYQALDPVEKKKLATAATPKPLGAATALKPVPSQKLATVPVTRQTQKNQSVVATTEHVVNRNTLLPRSQPLTEPAPSQKN
jgi:hypothetical protein